MAAVDIIRHTVMMMSVDYNVNVFSVHVLLCGADSYPLADGKRLIEPHPSKNLLYLAGGKRGDYQNCSVLYCVLKLCTVIR